MNFLLSLLIVLLPFLSPAASSTEADTCVECNLPKNSTKINLTPLPVQTCEKKALLFDPQFKTYFEKNKVENVTSQDAFTESFLSCLFGLGRGVFLSVKDLLNIIPVLIDGTVALSKATFKGTKKIVQDPAWAANAVRSLGQTIGEKTSDLFQTAKEGWAHSSAKVRNAYLTAGVGGAVSAMTVEMAENSPAPVIKNVIGKFGSSIRQFVSKEWDAFGCMTPQAQSQVVCSIASYVATDVVTGKLIWGNLAKSTRFLDGIDAMKKKMLRTPVLGDVLMKDFKPISKEAAEDLREAAWRTDGKMKLEGQAIEVFQKDGQVYARGVDPKTKELTVYSVDGSQKKAILERLKSSPSNSSGLAKDAEGDFFSPNNSQIARTMDDFVRGTNRTVDVDLSSYHARKVGQLLEASPETAEEYGSLLKSVDIMSKDLEKQYGKKLPKEKASLLEETRGLVKEINGSLANTKPSEVLNLKNLKSVIDDAMISGDVKAVRAYRNAIAGLNNAGGPQKFDSFFSNLGFNKIASEEMRKKVKECLITGGAK